METEADQEARHTTEKSKHSQDQEVVINQAKTIDSIVLEDGGAQTQELPSRENVETKPQADSKSRSKENEV